MRLIDSKKRDISALQHLHNPTHKSLRRDIKQFYLSCNTTFQDVTVQTFVVTAVQCLCCNTISTQTADLVFHQRDKWRYNNGHSLHHQSCHLKAQRLAATRWHQNQRVATIDGMLYDLFLHRTECVIPEIGLQDLSYIFNLHNIVILLPQN